MRRAPGERRPSTRSGIRPSGGGGFLRAGTTFLPAPPPNDKRRAAPTAPPRPCRRRSAPTRSPSTATARPQRSPTTADATRRPRARRREQRAARPGAPHRESAPARSSSSSRCPSRSSQAARPGDASGGSSPALNAACDASHRGRRPQPLSANTHVHRSALTFSQPHARCKVAEAVVPSAARHGAPAGGTLFGAGMPWYLGLQPLVRDVV